MDEPRDLPAGTAGSTSPPQRDFPPPSPPPQPAPEQPRAGPADLGPIPTADPSGVPSDTDVAAAEAQRRRDTEVPPVRLGALQPAEDQWPPPGHYPDGANVAPPPERTDGSKFHYAGTDKNIDDPADANQADVEAALAEGPWEAAPQPFRKRDGFPDLTQESVNIRLDRDYWPADTGRFQNGANPRGRAGELLAFPSDEAIALIEFGIGHREDTEGEEAAEGQRRVWKERDEDAERAKEEARKRREDDGA